MHDDRDDQVRALFHRIDDGPPLDIDVHDVMARGKRVRTRRTGLAVAGTTLAVAGAVVVSLSLVTGARTPDLVPADPPSVTSTPQERPSTSPSETTGSSASDMAPPPDNEPATNSPPAPGNSNGSGSPEGDGNAEGDSDQPLPEDVSPPPGASS